MTSQFSQNNRLRKTGLSSRRYAMGFLCLLAVMAYTTASAQKSFTLRKSFNINGDFTMIGNSNLTDPNSGSDNNSVTMSYIDVDADPSTINSSSADLSYYYANGTPTQPGNTEIVYAGLYWAGRAEKNVTGQNYILTINGTDYDKREVQLKGPSAGSYTTITANNSDIYYPNKAWGNIYIGYADVTTYVQNHGIGIYTVADIALKAADGGNIGYFGGWTMVVVYKNPEMISRSIILNDGYRYITKNGSAGHININNLNPPTSGNVNVKMGYFALEGDKGITGDYLAVQEISNNQFDKLKHDGSVNTGTQDFFNSAIYNRNSMIRNPSNTNNYGIDIGVFNLDNTGNTYINNNSTDVTFEYGTNGDTYVLPFLALSTESFTTKGLVVNDANGNEDNAVNPSGSETLPTLYANIVDPNTNKIIASLSVTNGEFELAQPSLGAGDYICQLSAHQGTVNANISTVENDPPGGWVFTGESIEGGPLATGGTQGDGQVTFNIDGSRNVSGLILGLNKLPSAQPAQSGQYAATSTNPYDLDGTNIGMNQGEWKLPKESFEGSDNDGNIDKFVITTMPANVDKITINGTDYTSIPAGGIEIPANAAGTAPKYDIKVHSPSGTPAGTIKIKFKTIDNGGGESPETTAYFQSTQPLPVTLTTFTGHAEKAVNILNWTTGVERSSKGFAVQRSLDGRNFETIGFVASKTATQGNNNYSFIDKNPAQVSYYRLMQTDIDGATTLSRIIKIENGQTNHNVVVYPNPANNVLNIQQGLNYQHEATLVNMAGQVVKTLNINKPNAKINIANLPAGLYILNIGKQSIKVEVK